MADLASTDVAVSIAPGDREIFGAGAFKNGTLAQITFGNGSLTYPANGVPLPDKGVFGFRKIIDLGIVENAPGDGFVYKYDRTNHSIRVYTQGAKTGATAPAANENGALAKNSAGAEATAPRLPKTAASTTYDLGPMIELPAAITLPATVLKLLFIGE
jgi:hypothetical protein